MKFLIQILAIIIIVSTVCICAIKPEMHKTVLVYNSDYKLVQENDTKSEVAEMPVMEITVVPETKTVKKTAEITGDSGKQGSVNTVVKTQKNQTNVRPNKTESKTTVKTNPVAVTKTQTQSKPVQTVVKQEQKPEHKVVQTRTAPKILTQKEEEIAWNVWRSNLQNKIMQDVKLPALPNGIVFRFSFNVDKYGKITNIYTSSDNPAFTPYAIQYIAPVIRSYQGKSILNFPEGSSRMTTEFKGGWRISSSERLSTPQDYNDYEKVIKTSY